MASLAANAVRAPSTASATTMPYACQACTKRKVRCDKASPICSSCTKSRLECVYEASTRRRKRKLSNSSGDASEKLAQYERVLQQHGLLSADGSPQPFQSHPQQPPQQQRKASIATSPSVWNASTPAHDTPGKLLAGPDTSRYIYSSHWHDLGDDEMQRISEDMADEEQDQEQEQDQGLEQEREGSKNNSKQQGEEGNGSEPLRTTDAATPQSRHVDLLVDPLMGNPKAQSLAMYHPSTREATLLCRAHMENVEPICKILHRPTITALIQAKSRDIRSISKTDECLLFAVYHCAVCSMTDDECRKKLNRTRDSLLEDYYYAARQALINAAFLQTTNVSVLQALVLLLLTSRDKYDPHTYWIHTGVAVRIGQRMGLHKDGEQLGLGPFEVQMRRRLFYQLLPLDGIASKMSGTGIVTLSMQDAWDTKPPLSINDDQIWPGMTEPPEPQQGATEMSFCLARLTVARFLAKASETMRNVEDYDTVDTFINDAERDVEERFIRYCDMVNPLHVLTSLLARSAITAMRVRARLPKIRNQSATVAERRELLDLSQKIIDTDTAAYAHTGINRFSWHLRSFFVYGTWDSIIFVLTSLRRPDLLQLSAAEIEATWTRIESIYNNHPELFDPKKQTLYIAIGRLTLKAWDVNPHTDHDMPEPDFIRSLRSLRKTHRSRQPEKMPEEAQTVSSSGYAPELDPNLMLGEGFELDPEFRLDDVDWEYWDRLISDYQAQG